MDNKKMAAAMAAVFTYIKTQEEAMAAALPPDPLPEPPKPQPIPHFNVWGLSGRQAIMNAGNMMQMRAFK